ncbi:sulfotransferase [Sphingobium sp. H39-3-25]|uniref:tetratricopeptide repeat-containing sulfotransferase family protein n=1 Tax=Sphingobium arseniciresistens TaxID=3030834 RepID=UPI0023B937C4|nr:sulfotransferase [Sphingobium arseniciresistens]
MMKWANRSARQMLRAFENIEGMIAAHRIGDAINAWRAAVQRDDLDWRLWSQLGWIGVRLQQASALDCFRKAAELTEEAAPVIMLAHQQFLLGDRVSALHSARAALKRRPRHAIDYSQLASVLAHCDAGEEALPLFERAAKLAPDDPRILYNLATAQRTNGLLEQASSSIEAVLRLSPDDVEAYHFRSNLQTQTPEHNHIEALEAKIAKRGPDAPSPELHFALGKEFEDLGAFGSAFQHFQKGNRIRRAMFDYDVQSDIDTMQALKAQHHASSLTQDDASAIDAPATPIFIVGLPRSGTTLVERILAAHPDVTAGGELDAFPRAAVGCVNAGNLSKQQFVGRSLAVPPEQLADAYFREVGDRRGATRYFTDKLPFNSLYVGLISRAIPDAKIIILRRDPMANGFAIYSTLFGDAYPFGYALDELGAYMACWHGLIDHWINMLPARLFELAYEDLVSEPERHIRRLLDFCDLPWAESCLSFSQAGGSVSTASAVQVRSAIHARSVDKWRHYGSHLDPLSAALHAKT